MLRISAVQAQAENEGQSNRAAHRAPFSVEVDLGLAVCALDLILLTGALHCEDVAKIGLRWLAAVGAGSLLIRP